MAWGDPSDYWWLRPAQQESALPAMEFGARLRQQAINNALEQKQLEINTQRAGIALQEHFSKQEIQNKMMAGSSKMAKAISGFQDLTDPSIPSTIYGVLAENPEAEKIGLDFIDQHLKAVHYKHLQDESSAKLNESQAFHEGTLDIRRQEAERRATTAAGGTPEELVTVKDPESGAHFQLRGGKWYHIPVKDVSNAAKSPEATIAQRTTIYRDQIREFEKALAPLTELPDKEQARPENAAKIKELTGKLEAARARRDALLTPQTTPTEDPFVLMFDPQGNKVRAPRGRIGEFTAKGYRMAQ